MTTAQRESTSTKVEQTRRRTAGTPHVVHPHALPTCQISTSCRWSSVRKLLIRSTSRHFRAVPECFSLRLHVHYKFRLPMTRHSKIGAQIDFLETPEPVRSESCWGEDHLPAHYIYFIFLLTAAPVRPHV
jgi:hypothetical protein